MANTFKIIKTCFLISSWICMGLFSEISSPTLPYLKDRINCDYEEISRALVARAVGFLLGSLGGGIIGTKWCRLNDLWIFFALLVAGIATIVAPWCYNLPLLATMFWLDGCGKGMLAVVSSTSVMEIWQEKSAVPIHALHFSFGIGALIAPQVARPFIPTKRVHHISMGNNTAENIYNYQASNHTGEDYFMDRPDRIEIAYAIMGGITILCALAFLYFQLRPKNVIREVNLVKDGAVQNIVPSFCKRYLAKFKGIKFSKLLFFFIIFIFWCLPTGAERGYGKFLFAFAVEGPLQILPAFGTILETVFWASFTAGRGLATILSRWTRPHVLLAGEIIVKIICAILLVTLGGSNDVALFVVTGFFGATISPIFPASIVWANLYIEMTAAMNAFAFLSSSVGAIAFSWLAGYLFTYKGEMSLMHLMLGYALCTLVIYIVLFVFLQMGGLKRRENKNKEKPGNEQSNHLDANNTDCQVQKNHTPEEEEALN